MESQSQQPPVQHFSMYEQGLTMAAAAPMSVHSLHEQSYGQVYPTQYGQYQQHQQQLQQPHQRWTSLSNTEHSPYTNHINNNNNTTTNNNNNNNNNNINNMNHAGGYNENKLNNNSEFYGYENYYDENYCDENYYDDEYAYGSGVPNNTSLKPAIINPYAHSRQHDHEMPLQSKLQSQEEEEEQYHCQPFVHPQSRKFERERHEHNSMNPSPHHQMHLDAQSHYQSQNSYVMNID